MKKVKTVKYVAVWTGQGSKTKEEMFVLKLNSK